MANPADATPAPHPPRGTLRDHAYTGLRDMLIAGQVAPGDRLSIRDLAANLQVSAMPVREAIQRLVAENALEVRPQSAVRVPVMTRERFVELRTIRIALEGIAAMHAARSARRDDLDRIVAIHDDLRATALRKRPNLAEVVRANQQLHFTIYRAARMPSLLAIIEGLWLQVGPVINYDLRTSPARLQTHASHDHHANLVGALVRHDARGARRALTADIETAAAYILSLGVLPSSGDVSPS